MLSREPGVPTLLWRAGQFAFETGAIISIRVMQAVWERSPYKGEKLLVLLALADWSNDEGICWPSLPKIADKARISRRGVQLILKSLARDGAIEVVEKGSGRGHVTHYKVAGIKGALASPIKKEGKGEPAAPISPTKGERDAPLERANVDAQRANVEARKGERGRIAYKDITVKEPPKNRQEGDWSDWEEIMNWAEPFYKPFREAWNREYAPADYDGERKRADFAQLWKLVFERQNGTLTMDAWETAIRNYFKTPQASHTLADLSSRFVTFLKAPLDRYKIPEGEYGKANQQRIVGDASVKPGKYDHLGK